MDNATAALADILNAETCAQCGTAYVPCHTCTVRVGKRYEKRRICRQCEDDAVWQETVRSWTPETAHEQGFPCECGQPRGTINGTCVTCGGFEG